MRGLLSYMARKCNPKGPRTEANAYENMTLTYLKTVIMHITKGRKKQHMQTLILIKTN